MDPLNRLIFKKALKERAERVTIRDGREFALEYRTIRDRLENKPELSVWIHPASDSKVRHPSWCSPCGWFNVRKFMRS